MPPLSGPPNDVFAGGSNDTKFRAYDAQTGKVVHTGSARSITSIRYLGPRYASVVTERDTEENALVDAADQIRNGLAAFFANRRANASTSP